MGIIGAEDPIDVLLVRKYANMQMNKFDIASSAVSQERVLDIMNDYAQMQRTALAIKGMIHKKPMVQPATVAVNQ